MSYHITPLTYPHNSDLFCNYFMFDDLFMACLSLPPLLHQNEGQDLNQCLAHSRCSISMHQMNGLPSPPAILPHGAQTCIFYLIKKVKTSLKYNLHTAKYIEHMCTSQCLFTKSSQHPINVQCNQAPPVPLPRPPSSRPLFWKSLPYLGCPEQIQHCPGQTGELFLD